MSLFKRFFGHQRYLDMLDNRPGIKRGDGARLISSLPEQEAVTILTEGVRSHSSSYVRARCIRLLVMRELPEATLAAVKEALNDRSAAVRHAAVSFFGIRGGKGEPVSSIVPFLVRILETPRQDTEVETSEDESAILSMSMAASSALKATVGAQRIMIPSENPHPGLVAEFKQELERITADPAQDPVMREDGRRYLQFL